MQDGRSTEAAGIEGSVMFSLRELRDLEVERIEDEIVADRRLRAQREEAELAAAEAAAERVAAAERAEIQRREAEAAEREQQRRQNELELIAIEARLDREEEEHLQAVRLAAEAQAAIAIKRASPVRKLAGVVGAALLFAGITLALEMHSMNAELAKTAAATKAQTLAARRVVEQAKQAEVARFTTQLAGLQSQLAAVEERDQAAKAEEQARQATLRHHRLATAGATRPGAKSAASSVLDPSVDGVLDNL